MKKWWIIMLLCLCCLNHAAADAQSCYQPILDAWQATTGEELVRNICQYQVEDATARGYDHPKQWGRSKSKIRLGGTTEELIKDRDNWDAAIVSSKDVDLEKLANKLMLDRRPYAPYEDIALREWLRPKNLQYLCELAPDLQFYVYVYDYDEANDEATLIVCQDNGYRNMGISSAPLDIIEEIMGRRPADQARATETIAFVYDRPWDELLNDPTCWDVAFIRGTEISTRYFSDGLEQLHAAGLLFDFETDAYFASRTGIAQKDPDLPMVERGIFSADGQMIAVPCDNNGGNIYFVIVNNQSPLLAQSLDFATHLVKSYEWYLTCEWIDYDAWGLHWYEQPYIAREEMTW